MYKIFLQIVFAKYMLTIISLTEINKKQQIINKIMKIKNVLKKIYN